MLGMDMGMRSGSEAQILCKVLDHQLVAMANHSLFSYLTFADE